MRQSDSGKFNDSVNDVSLQKSGRRFFRRFRRSSGVMDEFRKSDFSVLA